MRVMRAEPNRFTDVTTKSVGAVWRAYDLQLTTYAVLLGAIGLVMAYTNSVEAGESVLRSGTTFTRALMWSGLAIVVFTGATAVRLPLAQGDALADLVRQPRAARPHPRDRDGRRRLLALDQPGAAHVPVLASSRRS